MKKIKLTKEQFDRIIQEQPIPTGLNITMGVQKQDEKENQEYYEDFAKKNGRLLRAIRRYFKRKR